MTHAKPLRIPTQQALAVGCRRLWRLHWAHRLDLVILVACLASYLAVGVPGNRRALYVDLHPALSDVVELPRAMAVMRCVGACLLACLLVCLLPNNVRLPLALVCFVTFTYLGTLPPVSLMLLLLSLPLPLILSRFVFFPHQTLWRWLCRFGSQ